MLLRFTSILFFALFLVHSGFAQRTITGKVISNLDKYALPGVTILEKGTKNGTNSNFDGNFSIALSSDTATLRFSFIGFKTKEVQIGQEEFISVLLKENCTREWFDVQEIRVSALSGLMHTPAGMGLEVSLPELFISGSTIEAGVSYQTNFNDNSITAINLAFKHLLVSCNFDWDIAGFYQKNRLNDEFVVQSFSYESSFNVSRRSYPEYTKIIAGLATLQYQRGREAAEENKLGPTTGLGTYIPHPIRVNILAKTAWYKGNDEYKVELNRRFKSLVVFSKYYNLGEFSELSIGAKYTFPYRFKSQKK